MTSDPINNFSDGKNAKLLLVEDHALIRESLIQLIRQNTSYEVVGDTGSGREAISLAGSLQPTIVLMDFHLGDGMEGIELIKGLRAVSPKSRILVLSADVSFLREEETKRYGAHAYISKSVPATELFDAIERLLRSDGAIIKVESEREIGNRLSHREREILRLLAMGFVVREIAEHLCISRKTVEAHRCNMRVKLGISNVDGLRRFARDYFGSEIGH